MTEPTGATDYRFGTTDEKQVKTTRPKYDGSNDDGSKGGGRRRMRYKSTRRRGKTNRRRVKTHRRRHRKH